VDEAVVAGSVDEGERDLATIVDLDHVIRIPRLARPIHPVSDAIAWRELRRVIRAERPDVVHTHMSKAGMLGRMAARREGVTVIAHTFHGLVLESYFSRAAAGAVTRIERALARRTDILTAVGPSVRADLDRLGVVPLPQVTVVPPGVDLTGFERIGPPNPTARARFGIPEDASVVGYIGRFAPVKRIALMIEVMERAAELVPRAHFLVAGGGPDRHLLDAATRGPLADRLHLVGWVADLHPFYDAVDVVLLVSANEGTPISLIEAGAAGRPCVATAVGGVPDVVRDGETGLLVPPSGAGAPEALARLLSDPSVATELGERARVAAIGRFTATRLARDLVALYTRALEGPKEWNGGPPP
jgi:glycosyltransferase involved in cell wall biosynthesis